MTKRKIVFGLIGLLAMPNLAQATQINLSTFAGKMEYDNSIEKSNRDNGVFYGVDAIFEEPNFALEGRIEKTDISYKSSLDINDTEEYDTTILAHFGMDSNIRYTAGMHYISTDDEQLYNGGTAIFKASKIIGTETQYAAIGSELFVTHFEKGHDELGTAKAVTIGQITPFFKIYQEFYSGLTTRIKASLSLQKTDSYQKQDYSLYEISFGGNYKNIDMSFYIFGGEARTNLRDGGRILYNTLDLQKNGIGIKVGYEITKHVAVFASYQERTFEEYLHTKDNTLKDASILLNFKFENDFKSASPRF